MMKQKLKNLIIKIGFPGGIEYFLLSLLSKCKTCLDGIIYPQYGVAPHTHNLLKTGSFIGSTEILSKDKWPDNYDDVDNGCGMWYCPEKECRNSKEESLKRRELWDKK